jgi:hypothetical protein
MASSTLSLKSSMKRQLLWSACVAAALFIGGCADPTGSPGGEVGEVSFRFEGADAGRFEARGRRPDDWSTRTHAAGLRVGSSAQHALFGFARGRRGLADQFFANGIVPGPGSYSFSEDRGEGSFYAELALGVDVRSDAARVIYVLTDGVLVLEDGRGGRLRGSFEGTARQLDGARTIRIFGGRFDVPDNLPRPVH